MNEAISTQFSQIKSADKDDMQKNFKQIESHVSYNNCYFMINFF